MKEIERREGHTVPEGSCAEEIVLKSQKEDEGPRGSRKKGGRNPLNSSMGRRE